MKLPCEVRSIDFTHKIQMKLNLFCNNFVFSGTILSLWRSEAPLFYESVPRIILEMADE
jgi:hypothetical protein